MGGNLVWSRSRKGSSVVQQPRLPFLGFVIGAVASAALWGVVAWVVWLVAP